MSVLNVGTAAIERARSGAKSGARVAVGALWAGCSLILDLGVRTVRLSTGKRTGRRGPDSSSQARHAHVGYSARPQTTGTDRTLAATAAPALASSSTSQGSKPNSHTLPDDAGTIGAGDAVTTQSTGPSADRDQTRVATPPPTGGTLTDRLQLGGAPSDPGSPTHTDKRSRPETIGWWSAGETSEFFGLDAIAAALQRVREPLFVVVDNGRVEVATGGRASVGTGAQRNGHGHPVLAWVPAVMPESLGDASFCQDYGLRCAYVTGAMANGIGSEAIVEAMSRTGMLGFFGAAGLPVDRVARAVDRILASVGDGAYGFNLIHSPNEPALEAAVVDLYLRRGVRLVEASAFLDLTLPLIRYRVTGIRREADGRVVCPNRVIAKVSRVELARKFFSPPPAAMLERLVAEGAISREQAEWASRVPIAQDLTAEADSGGHTDNRPAVALIPTMLAVRDEMQTQFGYDVPLRVGAAGGMATPASIAAAFSMGAAYIVTGSVNQACAEAGTSPTVKEMLAHAGQADVMMAPAADMFEMGVKVQVLKWGTMFAVRARKLYDLYRAHEGLHDLPPAQRTMLERDYLRCSIDEAWEQTRAFFAVRDPSQIVRAEADPKHKMALVFRSYLGRSSDWANSGEPSRKPDYQVWCGPAMGAFNEWVKGSFLERPENRTVAVVARNLMVGAAMMTRVYWVRAQGVDVPPAAARVVPMAAEELERLSC